MAGGKRAPVWLLVVLTAVLTAALTLGLDRGIAALRVVPTPLASNNALPQPVVVEIVPPAPEPEPSAIPADELERQLLQLQQQAAQHQGTTFVLKTERQISFALEALTVNDMARADRELVAAKASLDEALGLVAEDLKPLIATERLEIGRMRADLEINPKGLDEDLRRLRARLMDLIASRPQS